MDVRDPVDVDELQHAIDAELAGLGGPDARSIAICATSGTPQLSLALTLVAMSRFPGAAHYQALDPERAAEPLLRRYDPDVIRHRMEAVAAIGALESCQFPVAVRLFESRLASGTTVSASALGAFNAGRAVAGALAKAADLDARGASEALTPTEGRDAGLSTGDRRAVSALKQWYGKIAAGGKGSTEWPVELTALALRQRAAGATAASVLSAAIAFEAALTARLRTPHGLDPDNVKSKDDLPAEIRHYLLTNERPFRVEGAEKRSDWLARIDPQYARIVEGHAGARKALGKARNHLVHRGTSPGEEVLEAGICLLAAVFSAFGWISPEACPSSPAVVAALAGRLRQEAGIGTREHP
jgi:hypothetical protein